MLQSGIRSLRVQRRSVLWLVTLFALVGARAQPAEVAGTLPEDLLPPLKTILANASQQSPQALERALEVAQSEARVDVFNADRWPQLRGWAQFANNETAVSGDNSTRTRENGFFYGLELSQSIFRWGELKNKSALGRLGVLIAERNYAEAYRSLVQILRQSYMDLVARKMALKAARYGYQLAGDDLALAKSNFERGGISPADLEMRELAANEHAVRLAMQEEDFAAALRGFARLSGANELTEESIPESIPRPSYSPALAKTIVADALREGGKFSFEAEMNALRAQEADLNYRIAKVHLRPKLDAAATHRLDNLATAGPTAVVQTGVAYQTLAVRVNWAIFDGLATRGHMREALATREFFRRKTEQASEAALERVQQLERRIALDARMLEFGDARLELARESEQRQRAELELGKASELGIANAHANRLQFEVNNANVRANYLARWSEFVSLVGLDPAMNLLPARYVRETR